MSKKRTKGEKLNLVLAELAAIKRSLGSLGKRGVQRKAKAAKRARPTPARRAA